MNLLQKNSGRRYERGFTLIETLVAITVLTIAIVGPLQIVQGVLNSAYNARDQLIAAGLAQEAMEYIREIRDDNYLNNVQNGAGTVAWLQGPDGYGSFPDCYADSCTVDPEAKLLASCGSGSTDCVSHPLYLGDVSGTKFRYNQQTTGTQTKYSRAVKLTKIGSNDNESLVTVTVKWNNHGAKSVVLQEYLKDWQND